MITLNPGKKLVVDSGHIVAHEVSVQMTLSWATQGLTGMVKTAEGLILEFTGPGRVWVQYRNPN
ncbi:MAG: AIM24 family protein [Candidatus Nanopelagicales bacterium]